MKTMGNNGRQYFGSLENVKSEYKCDETFSTVYKGLVWALIAYWQLLMEEDVFCFWICFNLLQLNKLIWFVKKINFCVKIIATVYLAYFEGETGYTVLT